MGQTISVEATIVGNAAIFDADRSISGQDGHAYTSASAAGEDDGFPAQLAGRVFAVDTRIVSVYTGSNGIVVLRDGGWDDTLLQAVRSEIEEFFVFYRG